MKAISQQTSTIRVLVVEDHELTRYCLQLSLEQCGELELVGMASDGLEAIEMAKHYRPDVLVMDLQMPVLDGIGASKQIKAVLPDIKIVAYSSQERAATDFYTVVDAYCLKDTPVDVLIGEIKHLGRKKR